MASWVLAIDFGTTTTSAAVGVPGVRAEVVELGGSARMPSVVMATESGELVVGAAAEGQLALAPERAERTPKRRLGDEVMLLGTRPVRPVEAVAAILKTAAAEAVRHQGGEAPAELRLTHPARWGSVRRAALAEAAALAGLPEPVFVPEPVAAAVHFADERIVPGAFVAVYDLGGGTFDTAVLRRSADGFDVVGIPGGDERLGGEIFDDRLFAHVGERLAASEPEAWEALRFSTERSWRKAGHDLRTEVRHAKEALSANAEYTIYVGSPVDTTVVVTRDELEALIAADVASTVDELEATVSRAGLAIDQLAAVNLVGGSSRIPLVTRLVAERFGQLPQTWGDPKAAVALGAARATQLSTLSSLGSGSGADASGGSSSGSRTVTPLPERVGDYRVVAELGRGGMGVVYLATQPSLGRPVAVKALPLVDPNLTDRLEREAAVLAELQHPNVATVIDVGTDERGTHVVMPFFPGGTLTHVLARDTQVDPAEAASVLASVAEALAATHAKGFLHRDVKPSNILLSADGDPYLADFGLALPMLDSSRLTNSRAVLGTAPYTAPEILADQSPTPAADAYALGVTGYQLLTGQLPYAGSNVLAVLDAVRRGEPTPIGELAAGCPPELAVLVTAAFAADPADRPEDLRAWAAQVRASVQTRPVRPAPPLGWAAATAAAAAAGAPVATGAAADLDGELVAATAATPVSEAEVPTSGGGPREPATGELIVPEPAKDRGRGVLSPQRMVVAASLALLFGIAVAALALGGGDGGTDEEPISTDGTIELPDVVGDLAETAEDTLAALGLEVETEVVDADEADGADPGTVVSTDPEAGTELEEGDTVTLLVAPGEPEMIEIPEDLVGKTSKEGRDALEALGFVVVPKGIQDEFWPVRGLTVGTLPRPGTMAPKGSEVELHFSVGVEPSDEVAAPPTDPAPRGPVSTAPQIIVVPETPPETQPQSPGTTTTTTRPRTTTTTTTTTTAPPPPKPTVTLSGPSTVDACTKHTWTASVSHATSGTWRLSTGYNEAATHSNLWVIWMDASTTRTEWIEYTAKGPGGETTARYNVTVRPDPRVSYVRSNAECTQVGNAG